MFEKLKEHLFEIISYTMIAVLVFLAGVVVYAHIQNEKNKIDEGTVVDKYSYLQSRPVVHRWYHLKISGEKNGKMVEYDMEVDKSEYEEYEIGDHYPKNDTGE